MFRLFTTTSIVSMALGVTTLAGCASTRGGGETSTTSAGAAMSCPTCETVWVRETSGQGTKIQRFSSKKQMVCPDCDASAAAYLSSDGQKVLHNCPQCKVTPTPLTPVPAPQPSHPKGTHS